MPDNECLLTGQPLGIELDYRVVAGNEAGVAEASGVVTVVL